MSKEIVTLTIVLMLSTAIFGQQSIPVASRQSASGGQNTDALRGPDSTDVCTYQFTSGGSATKQFLQYCVTVNGNIVEFQSPAGVEHIKHGIIGEGYAVCDFSSGVGYHDYAAFGDADNGSWGPATRLNLTATTVKISRISTDGRFTLTQTITQSAADASAKITMALKNNSAGAKSVWFTRVADVDANDATNNILDGTFNTAFGYSASAQKGLQLSLAAANPYEHVGYATQLMSAGCSINVGYTGLLSGADGVIYFNHGMTIGPGKTATVVLKYRGI